MGETPLDFRTLAALKDAFAESNLTFRVDVVDWAATSEAFKVIIEVVVAGDVCRCVQWIN